MTRYGSCATVCQQVGRTCEDVFEHQNVCSPGRIRMASFRKCDDDHGDRGTLCTCGEKVETKTVQADPCDPSPCRPNFECSQTGWGGASFPSRGLQEAVQCTLEVPECAILYGEHEYEGKVTRIKPNELSWTWGFTGYSSVR